MIEKIIASLSVPSRREILNLLRNGERTSTSIAEHFDISAPAISQHLKILESSGLVSVRKSGTKRFYRIRKEGFKDLKEFVDQFWDDSLLRLKEAAEEEERRNNEQR